MKRSLRLSRPGVLCWALAAATISLAGCSGGGDILGRGEQPTRVQVVGTTQQVSGAQVVSWATINRQTNLVEEVGVTVPLAVIQNPPSGGSGPAGAFAVLPFPAQVKSSAYFDHVALHWNPAGHPPQFRYGVPHFDFHFYSIPSEEVARITPPDPTPPAADRVPSGYTYPGPNATVPQMGVHASPNADFAPGAPPFTASMVLGYYGGRMIFLEPMVTQSLLLQQQNVTLAVPRPAVLGRATRYPTTFRATYNAATDSYEMVFSDFVSVAQ